MEIESFWAIKVGEIRTHVTARSQRPLRCRPELSGNVSEKSQALASAQFATRRSRVKSVRASGHSPLPPRTSARRKKIARPTMRRALAASSDFRLIERPAPCVQFLAPGKSHPCPQRMEIDESNAVARRGAAL